MAKARWNGCLFMNRLVRWALNISTCFTIVADVTEKTAIERRLNSPIGFTPEGNNLQDNPVDLPSHLVMQQLRSALGIATPPLEVRHQPSGVSCVFNGSQLTFADYVARNRDMLSRAHSAAGAADLEKTVDGNAPFELKPPPGFAAGKQKTYLRGVLLTHGLSDSPYFMCHLAEFFQENGFRVMAVLLPGHGTQPGDLLEVTWPEWVKTVAYGAYKLAEEVDEVYLAGYSTGATLSVYQSLRDNRVRGLFLGCVGEPAQAV